MDGKGKTNLRRCGCAVFIYIARVVFAADNRVCEYNIIPGGARNQKQVDKAREEEIKFASICRFNKNRHNGQLREDHM
jgi:hypothetical protein